MSTTTIRIEDDLKSRIAAVAARSGTSAHAFIVDAIVKTVEQSELDDEFHRLAEQRWAKLVKSGKAVSWGDAKAYLEARACGSRPHKPPARKLAP